MIKIKTNSSSIEEKTYIFDFIFSYILGLEFKIEFVECDFYSFHFNSNIYTFPDIFFSKVYLKNFIFQFHKHSFKNSDFLINDLIPDNEFITFLQNYNSKPVHIDGCNYTFNFDLVGTCFFLLSRYEEKNSNYTDQHNRFPFKESLASKLGFADRPLVDEYVEFLWNLIKSNNPSLERKTKEFTYHISHDIDRPVYKLNKLTEKRNTYYPTLRTF